MKIKILKSNEFLEFQQQLNNILQFKEKRLTQETLDAITNSKNQKVKRVIVIYKENVIGYGAFEPDTIKCGIVVHPQYRNKKIGDRIVKKLIKLGLKKVRIGISNIPSLNLFIKNGFKIIEFHDTYYVLKRGA